MDPGAHEARAQLVAALAGWPEVEPETRLLLKRLPWRQRQAVTLVLGERIEAGYVAVTLGVSEATIRRDVRAAALALFGAEGRGNSDGAKDNAREASGRAGCRATTGV